jgi:hypothetical protein
MLKHPSKKSHRRLLELQIAYAVVGSLFNLVSLMQIMLGHPGLTSTSPIAGLTTMAIILLAAIAGINGYYKVLLAINVLLITPLLYSGVFAHLRTILSSDVEVFIQLPLSIAVAINSFGSVVMTLVIIFFIKLKSLRDN